MDGGDQKSDNDNSCGASGSGSEVESVRPARVKNINLDLSSLSMLAASVKARGKTYRRRIGGGVVVGVGAGREEGMGKVKCRGKLTHRKKQQQVQVVGHSQVNRGCHHQPPVAEEAAAAEESMDNMTVIVRIRPRKKSERVVVAKTIVKVLDSNSLLFDPKEDAEGFYFHGVRQKVHDCSRRANKDMSFVFDFVYGPKNTNVEIFESSLKAIVGHIIHGYSCSVFAYGATGSGKTFTMLGNTDHPGLTFLMAMELYKRIGEIGHEYETEIVVSYLEVYNETLKDLLHPSDTLLSIRENGLNGISVPNLTKHKPKDASAMLSLLSYGNSHRTQHPTDHNSESSRSHAIFEVGVCLRKKFSHLSLKYKMTKAKLVMIDLAGSERGTGIVNVARNREGSNINKSLLALGNCINALADGKRHIPYRDSKLTRILKDSLGGNCKTVMIANISPTSLNYDDTYNSLKYADRAKEIRIVCKKTVFCADPCGGGHGHAQQCEKVIAELQLEVAQLKEVVQVERDANRMLLQLRQGQGQSQSEEFGGGGECEYNRTPTLSLSPSPLVSLTSVVADPNALESFIQLLSTKKKQEEVHAESTLKAKEAEWLVRWKQWRIESIRCLGRGETQEQTHLMKTSLERLRRELDQCSSTHRLCTEQVELAKQVLDYNEKEIEHLRKHSLSCLKMEDPFLAVTLAEFLHYKALEREVVTHKCIENHHQGMCGRLLHEMLTAESHLTSLLAFQQALGRLVREHGCSLPEKEAKKQSDILKSIYGYATVDGSGGVLSNLHNKRRYRHLVESAQHLLQVFQSPAVEYEPPPTTNSTAVDVEGDADVHTPTQTHTHTSASAKCTESYTTLTTCSFTESSASSEMLSSVHNQQQQQQQLSDCNDSHGDGVGTPNASGAEKSAGAVGAGAVVGAVEKKVRVRACQSKDTRQEESGGDNVRMLFERKKKQKQAKQVSVVRSAFGSCVQNNEKQKVKARVGMGMVRQVADELDLRVVGIPLEKVQPQAEEGDVANTKKQKKARIDCRKNKSQILKSSTSNESSFFGRRKDLICGRPFTRYIKRLANNNNNNNTSSSCSNDISK